MASHFEITSNLPRFQQHRPMMLKDFLRDDSCQYSCTSSSSSPNGFPMHPKNSALLLRSRSKKAAATTISAVVNVVKFFQFASARAPLVLPRSISRKLLTKSRKGTKGIFRSDHVSEVKDKVKVKDILRWKSFRDLVEDDCTPLDLPPSPNRSTTTDTTTTTTTSCSKSSSWSESDFTAEELLPPWGGENEEFLAKKCNFLGHPTALRNHKGDWSFEEYEQQSPVSVLDSPFREVLQDSISPFHPILANVERTRCMLTRRFQEIESNADPKYTRTHSFGDEISIFGEKAKLLLSHVQEFDNNSHDNDVVLDFFMHELSINGNLSDFEFDRDILKIAKSWINDEYDESYEWELKDKRESYVKDMEKGVCWKKFKQEQQELSEELEVRVFEELIGELMDDIFSK